MTAENHNLAALTLATLFGLITSAAIANPKQGKIGSTSSGSISIVLNIQPSIRQYQATVNDVIDTESTCFSSTGLYMTAKTETAYCPDATFNLKPNNSHCITINHSNKAHTDRILIEPI